MSAGSFDLSVDQPVCIADLFGLPPYYYTQWNGHVLLSTKITDLLPYLPDVEIDLEAFREYLTFQYYLGGKTMFKGIREVLPAHSLDIENGKLKVQRYWEVSYALDFDHTAQWFQGRLQDLLLNSVEETMGANEDIGAYVSGGVDSSSVAALANGISEIRGYHGTYQIAGYTEERYAQEAAKKGCFDLTTFSFGARDFVDNIGDVIRCLEQPMMGPGAFSQYMLAKRIKGESVMLSGQGGDELFGGYARYIIAYFEQCLKAAIDGTTHNGNFIVTYESILPNLRRLKEYKPLMKQFWAEGLFDEMDRRYYRLINRANTVDKEIRWECLDSDPFESFSKVFYGNSIGKQSYFDLMTHYDFKAGLPPMLAIEHKINNAHALEVRCPFLDRKLVEFAATIPSNIKFKDGNTKHVLKEAMRGTVPDAILNREDKMGFPTPIVEWANGEARDFVHDILGCQKALQRDLVDNRLVLEGLEKEPKYSRKLWGLLALELWCQEFLDKEWRR